MKVFCPEHKKGFFAPRQSPIKCENRNHLLGEFNFAGADNSQVDLQWQYCCNCEHFCPISPEQQNIERCPVCSRPTSALHICDRCFTISFESNSPVEVKNFTLTSDGLPQPACPGCLQASSGEVREHVCDELGAPFTTALTTCPICRERLDVGPTFPSLVSHYLRKTKTANKVKATFDYDSGLFVEVNDGEFVIVTSGADSNQAFVLPRLTHLSSPQEFYEVYQDYYHHNSALRAGELLINEPAVAERSGEGWKFQTGGLLEVAIEQPRAPRKIRPGDIDTAAPEESEAPVVATKGGLTGTTCSQCGSMVEERYAFCWHCGQSMKPAAENAQPGASPRRFVIKVDESSTAQPPRGDGQSSIFSSDLSDERIRGKNSRSRRVQ